VYRFSLDRNAITTLPIIGDPRGQWHHVLGIDLGYSPDPSAFVIAAYHDHDSTLYFTESWKQWRLDITDVAQRVQVYQAKYDLDTLIIDGANKQAVAEMQRRHGLPLVAASKTAKADFIELMNAEFILGRIKVITSACNGGIQNSGKKTQEQESLALHDEYGGLVWDERALVKGKREEHPRCPNHLADAALYAWRYCFQYLSKAPLPLPVQGDAEWYREEEERLWEAELDVVRARIAPSVPLESSENWDPLLDWKH